MITLKPTQQEDLKHVQSLWNDGEVMQYVGFKNGIGITMDKLKTWLTHIQSNKHTEHFCIHHDQLGFLGETFYALDLKHDIASLDIKLFKKGRGKGVAYYALSHSINTVFDQGLVSKVYVDPSLENLKALKFYDKLGFKAKERPTFLEPGDTYFELDKETWLARES